MAVSYRVNVTGLAETRRYFQRLGRTLPRRAIPDALVELGLRAQKIAAEEKIERGGSGPPLPDRLTSRTGTLRRSIRTDRRGLPRYVEVGTDLVYGGVHELGGLVRRARGHFANYPARPFLKPALEQLERSGAVRKVMNKHLSREIEGSPL